MIQFRNHGISIFQGTFQSLGMALHRGNARAPLILGIRIKRNKQKPAAEVDESSIKSV